MSNFYLPLFYLEKVKRPGKKYFLTSVIYTDLVILLLGLTWSKNLPIVHGLSILFLLLSFWCIYEIGYYENDVIAEKYEANPVLSKTYGNYKNSFRSWRAWLWSIVLSIPGFYLLHLSSTSTWIPESEMGLDILKWSAFLGLMRLTFFTYNHLDKQTRIWLYPLLQIHKYFGYLLFIPINLMGSSLFVAQILSSSTSYIVYRHSKSWPDTLPNHFIRLALFLLLIFTLSISLQNYSLIFNWQLLTILIYCIFRARHEITKLMSSAYLISQDKKSSS